MEITVNQTPRGTRQYPRHSHKQYEIMHYTEGVGEMWTEEGALPFSPGTVAVIPPNILHGSISNESFVNISIECDFNGLLLFERPTLIVGTENDEGSQLVDMIWKNRCGNEAYLHALCTAYVQYLLQKVKIENEMETCIQKIIRHISEHAFDPDTDVTEILKQSGYAEDYVRACFKKETGKTPIGFLTDLRIRHACYLIDIYKNTLSLSEIAERCGYADYIYFSKKFKECVGRSPRDYKHS